MSAQRLGRARKLLMLHGGDGKHRVSQVSGSSTWTKALGEAAIIRAWLIFQCAKRLLPGISSAQANCGLQSPNRCALRFCSVVRLSIRPVDDVGSITKTIWKLGTERSPVMLHEPHGRQTTMLAHQWRLLGFSSKCRRRRKHTRKNTWSVAIVIFVRTERQHWTQPVITSENSENSYSFMISGSPHSQRKFWFSRTLPSNFFSTKWVAKCCKK